MVEFSLNNNDSSEEVLEKINKLSPWKKGPYKIGDFFIDSEWRSDLKWERLQGMYSSLENKTVCDVGCNNGYFMFQMLKENPRHILGIDPVDLPYEQFQFLNKFSKDSRLEFQKIGVMDLVNFSNYFDTIFCLGILYHHKDPLGVLKVLQDSMKEGGELILENMGIPGEDSHCLVPFGKYAGARGMWFIPTATCIENWLKRSGFNKIKTHLVIKLTEEEQRRSKNADIKSLPDFLNEDQSKTIEGYPAPVRIYTTAVK